jgi:hypothetical protein
MAECDLRRGTNARDHRLCSIPTVVRPAVDLKVMDRSVFAAPKLTQGLVSDNYTFV